MRTLLTSLSSSMLLLLTAARAFAGDAAPLPTAEWVEIDSTGTGVSGVEVVVTRGRTAIAAGSIREHGGFVDGDAAVIRSYDVVTGQTNWSDHRQGLSGGGSLEALTAGALRGRVLVVGGSHDPHTDPADGTRSLLWAYDARKGTRLWSWEGEPVLAARVEAVVIARKRAIAAIWEQVAGVNPQTGTGAEWRLRLVALRLSDGEPVWTRDTEVGAVSGPRSLATVGGRLVVADSRPVASSLHAFDLATGEDEWTWGDGNILSNAWIYAVRPMGRRLLVGGIRWRRPYVACVSGTSGEFLWTSDLEAGTDWAGGVVTDLEVRRGRVHGVGVHFPDPWALPYPYGPALGWGAEDHANQPIALTVRARDGEVVWTQELGDLSSPGSIDHPYSVCIVGGQLAVLRRIHSAETLQTWGRLSFLSLKDGDLGACLDRESTILADPVSYGWTHSWITSGLASARGRVVWGLPARGDYWSDGWWSVGAWRPAP
jgi:hypothetical protein